nr:hypothetical protein CFP56_19202 [Quercus suber]
MCIGDVAGCPTTGRPSQSQPARLNDVATLPFPFDSRLVGYILEKHSIQGSTKLSSLTTTACSLGPGCHAELGTGSTRMFCPFWMPRTRAHALPTRLFSPRSPPGCALHQRQVLRVSPFHASRHR